MIRMISGVTRAEDGLKTPESEPFSLSAASERRLIELGVAVNVGTLDADTDETSVATLTGDELDLGAGVNTQTESAGSGDTEEPPAYSINTKLPELRSIMEGCGLPYRVGMKKTEIIAALDEHYGLSVAEEDNEGLDELNEEGYEAEGEGANESQDGDDDEEPPELSPEAPGL